LGLRWSARVDAPALEALEAMPKGQVPETLDNRSADALDGERTGKISGMGR